MDGSNARHSPTESKTEPDPDPGFVCMGEFTCSLARRYKMPNTDSDEFCIVVSSKRNADISLVYAANGDVLSGQYVLVEIDHN